MRVNIGGRDYRVRLLTGRLACNGKPCVALNDYGDGVIDVIKGTSHRETCRRLLDAINLAWRTVRLHIPGPEEREARQRFRKMLLDGIRSFRGNEALLKRFARSQHFLDDELCPVIGLPEGSSYAEAVKVIRKNLKKTI